MAFSEIFVGAYHLTYRQATCRMCGVKLGEVFVRSSVAETETGNQSSFIFSQVFLEFSCVP